MKKKSKKYDCHIVLVAKKIKDLDNPSAFHFDTQRQAVEFICDIVGLEPTYRVVLTKIVLPEELRK